MTSQEIVIRPLEREDLPLVKSFTDRWIGKDYYSTGELEELYELARQGRQIASFLAFEVDREGSFELAGVRLTYAPGTWLEKQPRGLTPHKWQVAPSKAAYFKSLFVAKKYQRRGVGGALSARSLEVLKEMGSQAILCHSWLESPGNASQRYLLKIGFESVSEHQKFWHPVDYDCTRCAPQRCLCTAIEMIKYIATTEVLK